MEQIIGMFVNTVVIRLKFDNDISFRNLLEMTNEVISDAISHQDLTFDKIVEIVNPKREVNINPVFQVLFAWDDNLNVPLRLNGIESNKVFMHGGVSPFDITCSMLDNGEKIEGEIEYNIDLIKRDTIVRLRDNYMNLVSNLVSGCETPISSVPLISEEEKKRVLDFTRTSGPYPGDTPIARLFEEQVEMHSNKTAVVYKHDSLTYDQLNRKSNRLAVRIMEEGLEKNTVVGLLADKSIDLIVGILGILKAGGAYLPLDTEYPVERIDFMIRDSNCKLILTQNKHQDLGAGGVKKINLDSPTSYLRDDNNIVNEVSSDDLAYIMYTSGTTGKPKGSMIRQKSVVRLIRNTNYIKLVSEDRLVLTGAIVFDATTFEIWGSLLNGGSLYIPDKEDILDPKLLGNFLFQNEITTLWLTSALFTQIAEYRTDIFNRLKYLLVGGDVLSAPHINKVRRDNPRLKVINGYGPTENTTFTACYHIERDFDHNIPIGKPVSNTTVYIFDKCLNLQPVGVIGELYVGGDGLSKGYLNRDDLNSKKFIDNPYKTGERLYRTGDFGRWLEDGNIEFHGRVDNQVKIRGFRVELEEIESLMSDIEGVIEVVVKCLRPTDSDVRLVAFLNVRESFAMEPGEIVGLLKNKMPSYMIPSVIRVMHGFPLTISGKIDREALKYEAGETSDKSLSAFLTPTEEKICKIWCDVLKTRDILPEDNFFEIGGNSLLAISVINRIEENLNVSIQFKDLRKYPTLTGFGKFLEDNSIKINKSVELFHQSKIRDLPLTQAQTRMWLLSRLNPANPGYVLSFTYRLSGPLNLDIFQRSIEVLFHRHHVLFSSIIEKDGVPYCAIENEKVQIKYIDYTADLPEDKKSRIFEFINRDSRQAMDLKNDPLFRLYLFNLPGEEYYFYFVIHHIIFDGWSWQIFINDLNQIYNDLLENKEIHLKELEYQQYDFAERETRAGLLLNSDKLINYWKDQLEGCSTVLNFLYDFPRLNVTTGYGDREYIGFSEELSFKLKQLSKQEGVSLYSTMLTTFGILMQSYSGDQDINIGTPVANRSHSSMESIIGMFVNTVVIRIKFYKDISFRSLLKMTNEVILDAITHQDLSFDKIVEIVNPVRLANINPVFQVAFAWDENLNVPLRLNDIKSNKVFMHGGASPFDITCSLLDNGEKIEGEIEYNTDLIKSDTIINLCDNYAKLITNLVSDYGNIEFHGKVDNQIKVSGHRMDTISGKLNRGALKHEAGETRDKTRKAILLTSTEEKIYQIWCDVLKTKDILPEDNFFEIGGNSLLAISVLSKIESRFEMELGLRALFDKPRICEISEFIDSERTKLPDARPTEKEERTISDIIGARDNETKNIMSINPGGTKTSLFLIYCGNFAYFLSECLGLDQPIYGIFDDGWLTGFKSELNSVELIAKEYIIQLKKVLPEGPYIIGGHSFGGVIAYEMAVQLQKAGQNVLFLTLFDSMSPYANEPFYRRANISHPYKSIFKPVIKKLWQYIKMPVYNAFFLMGRSLPNPIRSYYIVTNYLVLLYKYRPKIFNVNILLFKVKEEYSAYKNYYGWDSLSEKVKNIVLEGDHMSMMTEKKYSEIIGKEIENYMAVKEN